MKVPLLFKYTKSGKSYYFYTGDRICDLCGQFIDDRIGILNFFWHSKSSSKILHHNACKKHLKKFMPLYSVHEQYSVLFTIGLPDGSLPVFVSPPSMRPGVVSNVFDAVSLSSDKVTDRTVYSGRECINGVSIGKSVKELDFESPDDDVDTLLLLAKRSKVVGEESLLGGDF